MVFQRDLPPLPPPPAETLPAGRGGAIAGTGFGYASRSVARAAVGRGTGAGPRPCPAADSGAIGGAADGVPADARADGAGPLMARMLTVAAAQLGPIQRAEGREVAVARMVRLLERAHARGVELVVFPELALTTFFPRHYLEDVAEADQWFEAALPSAATAPLFEAARRYGIGFHLGYAELAEETDAGGVVRRRRFNTAVLVSPAGEVVLKYRKVHLPGHAEYLPRRRVQHLEKRYFEVGNLGFPVVRARVGGLEAVNVGLMICNDRRWPEAWRVLGLQSVDLVMLGYNTPSTNQDAQGFEAHHLRVFHSHLSVQAGAYQNSCFAVATAKAGVEDGCELFGNSIVVAPTGEIMAEATTWGDELVTADLDFDRCELGRRTIFNFAAHRRPESYARIVDQVGAVEPPVV